jgi:hypothetical protein
MGCYRISDRGPVLDRSCMKLSSGFLYAFCAAALVLPARAQDSPKLQLTARELFYSAAPAPAATPAAKAATPAKAAAPVKKAPVTTAVKPKPAPAAPIALPDGGHIVATSATVSTAPAPSAGAALGLRYTILKLSGGEMTDVAPDTVFRAGDRIQFSVETNGPGYLYIISQGSSGEWKPMFPSADIAEGNNHIEGFRPYTMPPKARLVFDEQAGIEKIFIVFAREPEPNLESTIYSLQTPQSKQLLVASIDNSTVGKLRNTYARDLIIEKVDESTPGVKKEKAVYVVNPSGSGDSRVVADLHLVHQ